MSRSEWKAYFISIAISIMQYTIGGGGNAGNWEGVPANIRRGFPELQKRLSPNRIFARKTLANSNNCQIWAKKPSAVGKLLPNSSIFQQMNRGLFRVRKVICSAGLAGLYQNACTRIVPQVKTAFVCLVTFMHFSWHLVVQGHFWYPGFDSKNVSF